MKSSEVEIWKIMRNQRIINNDLIFTLQGRLLGNLNFTLVQPDELNRGTVNCHGAPKETSFADLRNRRKFSCRGNYFRFTPIANSRQYLTFRGVDLERA